MAEGAYGQAHAFLESRWQSAPKAQQEVLKSVSSGAEIEPRSRHAAQSLEHHGMLRQDGSGYRFSEQLMERYVRDHAKGGFFKRLFG